MSISMLLLFQRLPSFFPNIQTQLLHPANMNWRPVTLQYASWPAVPYWECWGLQTHGWSIFQVSVFLAWRQIARVHGRCLVSQSWKLLFNIYVYVLPITAVPLENLMNAPSMIVDLSISPLCWKSEETGSNISKRMLQQRQQQGRWTCLQTEGKQSKKQIFLLPCPFLQAATRRCYPYLECVFPPQTIRSKEFLKWVPSFK